MRLLIPATESLAIGFRGTPVVSRETGDRGERLGVFLHHGLVKCLEKLGHRVMLEPSVAA